MNGREFWAVLILMIFSMTAGSAKAQAAPYYRFWQGWKKEGLSQEEFYAAINQTFIPATVKTGMGKGLIGYLPVLPRKADSSVSDEVALVVYDSEADYSQLRKTPEGKVYSDLHWKFFDQTKGSRSLVPTPFRGKVEKQNAYDVLESEADWRDGYATYEMTGFQGDIGQYLFSLKENANAFGLVSDVVLISENYWIEYHLWSSKSAYDRAAPELNKLRDRFLIPTPFSGSYLEKSIQPSEGTLSEGKGINSWFDKIGRASGK